MKKYFYSIIYIALTSLTITGCASGIFTAARETYGEVFFAKSYIEDDNKFVGLGDNSFEQGEGIIYIYPLTKGGEYFNLKILNQKNNIVYWGMYNCPVNLLPLQT